jgi:hypothetical protein
VKLQKQIQTTCLAGFIVTAAVAIALPLVLIPTASRSDLFWFKVLWAVFLTGVVWLSLYSYFAGPLNPDEPRKGVGGVAPILAIGGFCYAAISLALMVVLSFLPNVEWLDRLHMAVQIVLGAAAVLLALFLRINLVFAERKDGGAKQNPTGNPPTK